VENVNGWMELKHMKGKGIKEKWGYDRTFAYIDGKKI